jgi:hypothetical protein
MTFEPRKQRTRQHVIADLSVHYVEGFILEEGHTAQRFSGDYSYDLVMRTFDGNGYAERGAVYFQLKAAEYLRMVGSRPISSMWTFGITISGYRKKCPLF